MAVARPVIYDLNMQLVEALEKRGIRARGIQHGVFRCNYLDRQKFGLVGEIKSVNLEPLRSAVRSGALPVLTFLGESDSGQVLNINADFAARELVWAVKPHKIVFLTPSAGLLDRDGRVISAISLDNDYEMLMKEPWVHSGMRVKLQQINEMLLKLDHSTSVSITSADQLTRELFTYRGAGTLVRRGESIEVDERPTPEKLALVAAQVEIAFERKLGSAWAQGLEGPQVLMAKSKRAAAVVVTGCDGVPYLDKFVVTPDAQGEGLASAMWQVLMARFPRLYWRSRNINPITSWYFQQADTSFRKGKWVVFTSGIDDAPLREKLIHDALARDPGWQDERS